MTRVALYTRVSTEDQAREGFSLDAQLERLRLYAKAQAWDIAGEYVDEGHSGRTTKRPQYTRMMAERAKWDTLLVLKMDRIHRNSRNFMAMMDQLVKESKGFASVTESLDTGTAMGRFVMDIIQRIAQLESEQIGERVYWGMAQKASEGAGILGFQHPYGYRIENGVLQPVDEEADVVRMLFQRAAEGLSPHAIAAELEKGGAPTKHGGKWARQTVRKILQNPVYCGFLKWKENIYANGHAPIVERDVWEKAQQALWKRRGKRDLDHLPVTLPGAGAGPRTART